MAVHQDYWPKNYNNKEGDKCARRWLQSLEISDTLLHPKPDIPYNFCNPSGKDFVPVSIKSIHPDHLIISYPNLNKDWDKKLPLKYAFAVPSITVRPVGTIKPEQGRAPFLQLQSTVPLSQNIRQNDAEQVHFTFKKKQKKIDPLQTTVPLPQNSSSDESGSRLLDPEHTVPFPQNIRQNTDTVHFTFKKKKKTRQQRKNSTKHVSLKRTYASSDKSRNRRARKKQRIASKPLAYSLNDITAESVAMLKQQVADKDNQLESINKHNDAMNTEIKEMNKKLRLYQGKSDSIRTFNWEQLNVLESELQNGMRKMKEARERLLENKLLCVICLTNSKNIVMQPCGHLDVCHQCEEQLPSKTCPRCDQAFTHYVAINH
eukprot:204112_1